MPELHRPTNPVRLVTASSLFDGHDASINIMRRIFQSQGCEVVHLGHNRSVREVVAAAIDEDVQGVAVSSYQGGHVEYFEYLVSCWSEHGAGHVKVVGGGGGVIVHDEIERLRSSRRPHLLPRGRPAARAARHGQQRGRRLRHRPVGAAPGQRRAGALRRPDVGRPRDHRRRAGPAGPGDARGDPRGGRTPHDARARHHRHRRLRQVLADRRAGPPDPDRPAGQAPGRRRGGRPDPAQGRRRPARRPDPDELAHALRARRQPRLLPLARHPRRPRAARGAGRRDRGAQGGGVRPGGRRDPRHRPGRRRGGAVRRRLDVRDDAGVRRRLAAGEDRHARLRRRGGDQQVRAPRRDGRDARRRAASWCATARRSASSPTTCRSSARRRRPSTTTASPRSTSTCAACWPSAG